MERITKKSVLDMEANVDFKILVMGNNGSWAKAKSFKEAYKNAYSPKKFLVLEVSSETYIDSMGSVIYPVDKPYKQIGKNF